MSYVVTPGCAEELSQVVEPWQLSLRQLASGKSGIRVRYTAVDDIMVTNERWCTNMLGHGGTARDYITVGGNSAAFPVFWQGEAFVENRLALAATNSECEFHTPHGANHWVILIPRERFTGYFGIESETELFSGAGILVSEPQAARRLARLCNNILDGPDGEPAPEHSNEPGALRDQLLSRVADLLPGSPITSGELNGRYGIFRRALEATEALHELPTVEQLTQAVGVSQRVLELAFKQQLGISPHRFLKLCRLNNLNHALQLSSPHQSTVTDLMEQHGFSEFGRTAGEFRKIFDTLPSDTLNSLRRPRPGSFLDAGIHRYQH